MQCLVNTGDESDLPRQAVTVFAWQSKKRSDLHYLDGRCIFLLTNSGGFFVKCCFWLVWLGAVGIYRLVFWKELIIEDSFPIPPYTQHHLLWMKTTLWSSVGGGSFLLLHNLFHSTLLHSIHFSSPVTICLKNGTFSLHLGSESEMKIRSRRFFSLNLCGTQTSKWLT